MSDFAFGLIGAGREAERHAAAISKTAGLTLCAVRSAKIARAREFAERHLISKSYEEIEYMLEDNDVDGVVAITSFLERADAVRLALLSQRPVISALPITNQSEDLKALIALSEREGVPIVPALIYRSSKAIRFMKSADIGKVLKISVSYIFSKSESAFESERETFSTLLHEGYLPLDILLYLGGRPESLSEAKSNIAERSQYDDVICALLKFKSGAIGSFEMISSAYKEAMLSVSVYGEKGTLYFKNGVLTGYTEKEGRVEIVDNQDYLASFYSDFITSFSRGEEMNATAEAALLVMKVAEALGVS